MGVIVNQGLPKGVGAEGSVVHRLPPALRDDLASALRPAFLAAASRVYADVVATSTMTPALQTRVRDLASQTDAIKTSLKQLSEHCQADLRLNAMADQSQMQRWIALAISALTFAIAVMVSSFMIRSTNTSLRTAVGSLNDVAAQVVSAAAELSTSAQSLSVALSRYRIKAFSSNPFITQGLRPTGDAHKYGFIDRF